MLSSLWCSFSVGCSVTFVKGREEKGEGREEGHATWREEEEEDG